VATFIETLKDWADTLHGDVDAMKALIEGDRADLEARKLGAAALGYLVTRMDLIPDWNEGIGSLDDVMVIRVCAQLAAAHQLGDLAEDHDVTIARLGNEAERISDFLGESVYDKLRAYCDKLADAAVRGRTPQNVVEDEAARATLYREVDEELKKSGPIVLEDPDDAELRLKAYLSHKLA